MTVERGDVVEILPGVNPFFVGCLGVVETSAHWGATVVVMIPRSPEPVPAPVRLRHEQMRYVAPFNAKPGDAPAELDAHGERGRVAGDDAAPVGVYEGDGHPALRRAEEAGRYEATEDPE